MLRGLALMAGMELQGQRQDVWQLPAREYYTTRHACKCPSNERDTRNVPKQRAGEHSGDGYESMFCSEILKENEGRSPENVKKTRGFHDFKSLKKTTN